MAHSLIMTLLSKHALKSCNWLNQSLMFGLAAAALQLTLVPMSNRAIAVASLEVAQNTAARPTLRLGSTGDSVEEVQALLTLLGYFEHSVDGNYQDTTEIAVRAFQQDIGLTDDGIVGPATWDKLLPTPSTEFNPPEVTATATTETADQADDKDEPVDLPTLRSGMYGPAVARVQETLKELGFYTGALDGIFGPGTEAAVKDFQRSVQLSDDGVVGPATWSELLR